MGKKNMEMGMKRNLASEHCLIWRDLKKKKWSKNSCVGLEVTVRNIKL